MALADPSQFFKSRARTCTVLKDRDDGTLWMVSFQTSEPSAHPVSLRSIDEVKRKPATIYRYAREPIIDRERGIRLIVRGGRLGYEFFPGEPIAGSGPTSVTTCTDSPHRMTEAWEIIVPSGWNDTPLAALQLLPPS